MSEPSEKSKGEETIFEERNTFRALYRSALVTCLVLLLGSLGACAASHPPISGRHPLPQTHRVSGEQAMHLVIRGALLVDISPSWTYTGRHLRGAHNIPWSELMERADELPRDRPIVIYSIDGSETPEADRFLRSAGFDVHNLGTFDDWHRSEERPAGPIAIRDSH